MGHREAIGASTEPEIGNKISSIHSKEVFNDLKSAGTELTANWYIMNNLPFVDFRGAQVHPAFENFALRSQV